MKRLDLSIDFMGFYGILWDFMGFYGILLDFMGFYGVYFLRSIEYHPFNGKSMDILQRIILSYTIDIMIILPSGKLTSWTMENHHLYWENSPLRLDHVQ